MTWPGITDFSEAVQNPSLCFRGTDLEAGEAELNPRGMPLVFSGAFACVYCVTVGGRRYAVRCFTREVRDQQERYNQLSDYLISALPWSFVHFEYLDEGINLRGQWYPIVRMEWVEGDSLSGFVGDQLGDPGALLRVAAQWRGGPVASLRGLRIAHNDLQHGNVMVQDDGRLRLVDYDGMFLPQFDGERSPELGHKHYQHPLRSADDYGAYVDNFPSLVIYLSLVALAADPGLWDFNNQDNLILTRGDYGDPGNSDVFARLRQSPDPFVVTLTERLEECCALPVEQVPDLEALLRGLPTAAPSAPSTPAAPPPAAAAPAPPAAAPPRAPASPRPSAPAPQVGRAPRSTPTSAPRPRSASPTPASAPPRAPAPAPARPAAPAPTPRAPRRPFSFGPPGEVRRVAVGVAVTVLGVTAAVGAIIVWAVAVRGW